MSQLTLEGTPIGHEQKTCRDCSKRYKKGPYHKCDSKPRGWGYDIKLSHPACIRFHQREEEKQP